MFWLLNVMFLLDAQSADLESLNSFHAEQAIAYGTFSLPPVAIAKTE